MKAVRFEQHGGPEVLQYGDVPEPKINAGEVLVKVRACALNHLDIFLRAGIPGWKIPLPLIPGSDISGEVVEVGELVKGVTVGQKVMLNAGISCRNCPACAAGDDNLCRSYHVFGSGEDGGYAELVKAPGFNVIPMPANLSFEEAAAVPLVFVTAWHMLVGRAQMRPGETVLVLGAGSGVGSAAIQIAKLFHGRVITTAGSEAKMAKARELGADEVINHATQDIAAEVRRLTNKRGVDVVIEHVGQATWKSSFMSLAVNGRLVTCGNTTGWDAAIDLRYLFNRHLSLLGSFMGRTSELLAALQFVGQGKLKAVVDRVFPLSEARQAQEYLESRQQFGKVVLKP